MILGSYEQYVSSVNRQDSGKSAGALIVSQGGSVNGSYSNLTDALAALPNDGSTQMIFMYPGTYNEQVPSINRDGPVQIIGHQSGNPGETYSTNQVTITFAQDLSVSPLPTCHSNAETATLSTASNKIALYNINIINSDNLDGSQSSYVTLAASIYGSQIGFYSCGFIGWQVRLDISTTNRAISREQSISSGILQALFQGMHDWRQKSRICHHGAKSSILFR